MLIVTTAHLDIILTILFLSFIFLYSKLVLVTWSLLFVCLCVFQEVNLHVFKD